MIEDGIGGFRRVKIFALVVGVAGETLLYVFDQTVRSVLVEDLRRHTLMAAQAQSALC